MNLIVIILLMFCWRIMAYKEDLNTSFVDKYCVVVGEYRRGYLYTDGYEKLKDIYFNDAVNLDIPELYNEDGELNEEVYNDLSICDIDTDVQQVLVGKEITENLLENEDGTLYESDENFFCPVSINGKKENVRIPKYLYK